MASLADRLNEDMKDAMRAREKEKLSVIRMLLSAVKDAQIEARGEIDDAAVMKLLMGYAKKRQDALAEAKKAGRDDLAAKEEFELEVVQSYLPEPLSDEELEGIVAAVIAETGASSMKDMGKVMKGVMDRAQGRADGSRINPLVKARLAG